MLKGKLLSFERYLFISQ